MSNPLAPVGQAIRSYFRQDIPDLKNASASALPHWNPADPGGSLTALYNYGEAQADAAIRWYYAHKRGKSRVSRTLRYGTIFATAFGGLIPIVVLLRPPAAVAAQEAQIAALRFQQWGYLSVGLAALFIALDRYSGASTGWMRYITTGMSLETAREQFRLDWIGITAEIGSDPDKKPEAVLKGIQRVSEFIKAIRGLVEKETQAWVTEFQTNLNQLDKETQDLMASAKAHIDDLKKASADQEKANRLGGIAIAIENFAEIDPDYDVQIDDQPARRMSGSSCTVRDVSPGLHAVAIGATIDGKAVRASQLVTVEPAASAKVSFKLVKGKT